MSIVLQGSTSGSVTLQEPAVAGTTVLDLPAVSGTILTTTSPKAGNVIQVVNSTFGTITNTSSATYVTSGLTASITPTSSSSRILILVSFPCTIDDTARQLTYTLYRNNTTNLAPNNGGQLGYGQLYNNVGNLQGVGSLSVLDSPATTSSTAYTVYFASTNGGSVTIFHNSLTGTITLMEIAG
jgi:hypothetical protein